MKNLNREMIKTTFEKYAGEYDLSDTKISLKVFHTYKVAEFCQRIGESLNLTEEELDIAWLCGMLHDIGRFEQVTRYGTFIDSQSVDHALLGAQVLFGENLDGKDGIIRSFIEETSFDEVICAAVRWHSAYRIPESLTAEARRYCQILRDADKIDILWVNTEIPMEVIYNVSSEELRGCSVTKEVMEAFLEHHTVLKTLKKTPIDNVIGHICLTYELAFPESRKMVREQGYLDRLLNFESYHEVAREQMKYVREHMHKYLECGIEN